jgi:hypothetical protein
MRVSYGAGWTVHVLRLGLAYKKHGHAGTCEPRQRLIILGPLIVSRSDARRKLHRLGH